MHTKCKIQHVHTICPAVTLKIEARTQKVDTFEILSMVIIYPNLKAIGEKYFNMDTRCKCNHFTH